MAVILNLTPETERRLREKAVQSGQTLEAYLQQIVERETQAADSGTGTGSVDRISAAEFDRRLDELSEGLPSLPTLPADWSRSDLHTDHD